MQSTHHEAERHEICRIGRRLYERGFVAANDGNISIRLGKDRFLCTPTLQSKGFLEPSDLVVIDGQGIKVSGEKERSSEALLHLEVYRQLPDITSVVHCHPPHATAFAVAREPIPTGILPEVEVFLGEVPTAAYETPGSQKFAETIRPFLATAKVIVLSNHGTISYDTNLEHAFWWTEILDAYCRVLMLAKGLGNVESLPLKQLQELILSKSGWGISDARIGPADSLDLAQPLYRDHWPAAKLERRAFADTKPPSHSIGADDLEKLAHLVAEKVLGQITSPK
jgi:L-fuculose-phosphate aldolase